MHEALVFVGQLANRPDSQYAALLAGGPQFFGWDESRYLAAETRDFVLALLTSLGGKTISSDDLYPRPQRADEAPQEAATIAEFNPGSFLRWLTS